MVSAPYVIKNDSLQCRGSHDLSFPTKHSVLQWSALNKIKKIWAAFFFFCKTMGWVPFTLSKMNMLFKNNLQCGENHDISFPTKHLCNAMKCTKQNGQHEQLFIFPLFAYIQVDSALAPKTTTYKVSS